MSRVRSREQEDRQLLVERRRDLLEASAREFAAKCLDGTERERDNARDRLCKAALAYADMVLS